MPVVFPFSAIVGQDEMKLALLIAAVDPNVGGVLVFGDRGTGKSTAVRALAALLPRMRVAGCRYNCDPDARRRLAAMSARPARQASPRASRRPCPSSICRSAPPRTASSARSIWSGRWRTGEKGVRARPAGARASRLPIHRRGEPARRPSRRPAARRGRLRRKRRRARGPERPTSRALRAGRQRQPGGGRAASRSSSTASGCRSRCGRRRTSRPASRSCAAATSSSATRTPTREVAARGGTPAPADHVGAARVSSGGRFGRDAREGRPPVHGARHRRLARRAHPDAGGACRCGARGRPRRWATRSCAAWRPPRCDTGCDATRSTRPARRRGWSGRWPTCSAHERSGRRPDAWSDATLAAACLALDPVGLGGAVLRSGAGPVRDRWLALLRELLPAGAPMRRLPTHATDGRLARRPRPCSHARRGPAGGRARPARRGRRRTRRGGDGGAHARRHGGTTRRGARHRRGVDRA